MERILTAHSGSDNTVDNSPEFVEMILQSGVDAFEMDCQISDQGELYLAHDSLQDSSKSLLLRDVFEVMLASNNHKIKINIDCKDEKCAKLALKMADNYSLLDRTLLSGSINLEDIAQKDREKIFYNLPETFPLNQTSIDLANLTYNGIKVVQLYYGVVTQEVLETIKAAGLELSVWTVNDIQKIDQMFAMGCMNVTTRSALAYLGNL
ncbi:glycerophosphodiester phosphodiesterase [Facklamia miroungae]|uniref:Glycerophosphoryl diester phosphodiesterase n=1 Tax=Facklamia miroungae TaxID=120956 RepID=A0A1G7TCJ0_9LACT|nr:glycerophosphodiester phosphodiesterase [Facklamia miroungae]NKZ29741.1 glycerophosphodiester phosphodiesterase [Facklamia miroungae]SDG32369.1 Glycerophosphoryl diester phosphodiesterase [Facklamia miroungae]